MSDGRQSTLDLPETIVQPPKVTDRTIWHVGVSGGKDSAAALLWLVRESGIPKAKIRATFCDIGNDHPWTLEHVKMLSERVHPIETVRPVMQFFELAFDRRPTHAVTGRMGNAALVPPRRPQQNQPSRLRGYMNETTPEIVVQSQPIDLEITELLGEKARDFLIMCFDGVHFEDFGTPNDTPLNRANWQHIIDALNDRSKKSLWPKMFENWKVNICKQFALPITTTAKEFRPVVSFKISRVCHGYSEHFHAAVSLFETLSDKISAWTVRKRGDDTFVEIVTKDFVPFHDGGSDKPALIIARAVRSMLKHLQRMEQIR